MTAQLFSLAIERQIRALDKAIVAVAAKSAEVEAELVRQRGQLDNLWIARCAQ